MRSMSLLTGLSTVIFAGQVFAVDVVITNDQFVQLTDGNASVTPADTYTVNGELSVDYTGNTFQPSAFVVDGSGTPFGPSQVFQNGRATLNSGTIGVGSTTIGNTSTLIVNTAATLGNTLNGGTIINNGVQINAGNVSSGGLFLIDNGSVVATSFASGVELSGRGTIDSSDTSFDSFSSINPGDPTQGSNGSTGILNFTGDTSVSVASTILSIDAIAGETPEIDQLNFSGAVDVSGANIFANFFGYDLTSATTAGPLIFLSATSVVGTPNYTPVELTDDNDDVVGTFELVRTSTLLAFQFVPTAVPEPGSLALLGLGAVGLLRRHRKTGER